jgi:hypothetical protein
MAFSFWTVIVSQQPSSRKREGHLPFIHKLLCAVPGLQSVIRHDRSPEPAGKGSDTQRGQVTPHSYLETALGGLLEYSENPEAPEYFQSVGNWPSH